MHLLVYQKITNALGRILAVTCVYTSRAPHWPAKFGRQFLNSLAEQGIRFKHAADGPVFYGMETGNLFTVYLSGSISLRLSWHVQ